MLSFISCRRAAAWTDRRPAQARRLRRVVRLIAVVACAAGSARASERPPLRLADVLDEAAQANPEIQLARQRERALRSVPAQVSAYDDPTLSWEAWDIPESLRVDQAENNIFRLAQKVPFPGKRTLAGTVATRDADAAHEAIGIAALDVAVAVKRAFADLWLAYQKRDILVRDKLLVERIARTTEEKYGVGEATQADALRAQVELTHMAIQADTAALAIDTAGAELNALLSRAPEEPLGVPEDPPMQPLEIGVEALTARALARRPELAAQRAAIAREQSAVELAQVNRRPDFEVSVGRFVNYGRSDGFGAMASVTVPFVNLGKYDAGIAEARAKLAGAEAELRRWEDRVRREVAQAVTRMRTAALEHGLARGTHIPQAEQALRVTETGYQAGTAGFLAVLDAVRSVEAIHIQHVEAQAALAAARADLERAVGGPLAADAD
jgi:cobalt-zinc-cadmium efflux system outer membrane protein